MYEKFTERARKVMSLANQEAQRFNHEYVGTEHMLLGLIKEGCGVAANVIKTLGLDLLKIRLEVEKLVQAGPEMVTIGRLPMTPRAKKSLEYAIESAEELNDDYIGTEHLLLGLIKETQGVAAQILTNLGLSLQVVKDEVLNLLGHPKSEMESRAMDAYRLGNSRPIKDVISELRKDVMQQAELTTKMLKLLEEI